MTKKTPIFYSALLLTAVNLLLRFAGTTFQVYLSGQIGAEGIGLLQLVLSVGTMSLVAGMAGIRTATMYLTAEERGREKPEHYPHVLSGCLIYSFLISSLIAATMAIYSPWIANSWIGNSQTKTSLQVVAAFLPVNCLCGVMVGFFTGMNRIKTLAAVEVAEQIFSIAITMALLHFWAGSNSQKACLSVVIGSGLGACLTLCCLVILRLKDRQTITAPIPIRKRIIETSAPLALADNLRTGISTVENLMVPRRLALYPSSISPLAAFGTVCGMVFPILTFPMAILFGLTELLIPELARCKAAGSQQRIAYLVKMCLRIALLFGTFFAGFLYLFAEPLCQTLYQSSEAGKYLKWFAPLAVMLYCDSMTDAMIKGLGQQKISVLFNILTNILDVVFLFFLLPRYGIAGYFASFLITHLINFALSIRHLLRISGQKISLSVAAITLLSGCTAALLCQTLTSTGIRLGGYLIILICLLYLFKILRKTDYIWFLQLLKIYKTVGQKLPSDR